MTRSEAGPAQSLWGGPACPPCFLDSYLTISKARSDQPAVVDGEVRLTYAELTNWVAAVAARLTDRGVGPGDRVAFHGSRGAAAVAAMLATWSVGATYVPLDTEYPAKRLRHMLSDSGVAVLLHSAEAPNFATTALMVGVSGPEDDQPRPGTHPAVAACRNEAAVYTIYTSGSTGLPKGVDVSHNSCDNMVEWQRTHSVRPDLTTAQFAPLNFDVCFQEILGTLCGGGTLVIVPERLRRDPLALLRWLGENRVERLFLPCVALHMLTVAASSVDSLDDLCLKEINTAGEQLVCTPAIREFFERLARCRLNNHYGQSESAMVTVHTLHGPSREWPALPPIGRPLPGCEVVIDPSDPDVPELGELLVAGLPLSTGYLNQPRLSAERYVEIGRTAQGHTRAFRTGDLVRVEDGLLHYLSRIDHEVKIRGVRVNPAEVDACLLDFPGVVEAVCVAVDVTEGSRRLLAAVTVNLEQGDFDTGALMETLAASLPPQALPQAVSVVAEFPRTPSGKIDREAVTALLVEQWRKR